MGETEALLLHCCKSVNCKPLSLFYRAIWLFARMVTVKEELKEMNVSGLCTSIKSNRHISHTDAFGLPTGATQTRMEPQMPRTCYPHHTVSPSRPHSPFNDIFECSFSITNLMGHTCVCSHPLTSNRRPAQTRTPGVGLLTLAPAGTSHTSRWQAEYVTDTSAIKNPCCSSSPHTHTPKHKRTFDMPYILRESLRPLLPSADLYLLT